VRIFCRGIVFTFRFCPGEDFSAVRFKYSQFLRRGGKGDVGADAAKGFAGGGPGFIHLVEKDVIGHNDRQNSLYGCGCMVTME